MKSGTSNHSPKCVELSVMPVTAIVVVTAMLLWVTAYAGAGVNGSQDDEHELAAAQSAFLNYCLKVDVDAAQIKAKADACRWRAACLRALSPGWLGMVV